MSQVWTSNQYLQQSQKPEPFVPQIKVLRILDKICPALIKQKEITTIKALQKVDHKTDTRIHMSTSTNLLLTPR